MQSLNYPAKTLIALGIVLIVIGGLLSVLNRLPGIGHLPGDICIKRGNFSFYFPLTTCILISLVISFLFGLWRRF